MQVKLRGPDYDGTSEKGERCVGAGVGELGEGRSSKDLGLELGFDFKWRESGDGGLGGKNVLNKG